MTLCDKAIREGVIYDFIVRHREGLKAEKDIPDVRRRNVIGLARRCQAPEVHALHVAELGTGSVRSNQTRTSFRPTGAHLAGVCRHFARCGLSHQSATTSQARILSDQA